MIIAAIIFGRVFCGWICPLGFIQDMVSYGKKQNRLPDQFRLIKYTLLIGGLLISTLSRWTFLGLLSPMSLLTQSLSSFFRHGFSPNPGVLILFIAILLTIITERRAWCRHFCPLGAALSLPSNKKKYKIHLDINRCIKCVKCDEICTMGVCNIGKLSSLRYENECTLCMNCRDACPVNAIKPS
jgi:ferredoxin-type protein NapH